MTNIGFDHLLTSKLIDPPGGIGAKRYCSSKHLGNYCDFVQNVGDQREYRSCIFTCSSDGCNGSSALKGFSITALLVLSILAIIRFN